MPGRPGTSSTTCAATCSTRCLTSCARYCAGPPAAFHADLAAAVTGRPDAPALLARAEREQLFVVPLDNRGDWYRFHHLFAEVLRDDLEAAEPDLVPQLHARAARWWAAHDQPVAAVRHALAGDDPELAAALVARLAPVLTRIGQVETALGWFRALGDDTCRADPRLAAARALTGAHTGRPHEIVSWTAVAERVLDAPAGGLRLTPAEVTAARIEIAMMRWTAAIFEGDARTSRQHVDEILRLIPDGAGPSSGFVLLALGVSQFRAGELDAAWVTLSQRRGGRSGPRARRALQHSDLPRRPGLGRAAGGQAAAGGRALPAGARAGPAQRHARGGRGAAHRAGAGRGAPRSACRGPRAPRRGQAGLASCPDPGYVWADPWAAEPAPPQHDGVRLTRRQAEMLALLAEALTTAEIGEHLKLSPRTVEAHLRTLYRKIDVRSRTAAARYAVEHGWTTARHAP